MAPLGRRSAAAEAEASVTAAHAYPARRCGECHEKARDTWATSAHARADSSPTYRAMRDASGRSDCERCHAPLRALVPDEPGIAAEGVTCDVCHTLRATTPDPRSTVLDLEIGSAVRYGPMCDLDDHYFHKMGCSPLHAQSALCGSCHWWTTHTSAVDELDVLTTYSDWRDGSYAEAEQTCQGCHMHAIPGEIAVGWGNRASVSDHSLIGIDDEVHRHAIDLELGVTVDGPRFELDVTITNRGAGHSIPTGLPAHRLIIHVVTMGADGEELARKERTYGRILVDERGAEVPFYAAQRVASDTRLMPSERRNEHFSFASSSVAEVRVEVYRQALSAEIARAVGVTVPKPIRVVGVRAMGPPRGQWEVETL